MTYIYIAKDINVQNERRIIMKINKRCVREIITCETTTDKNVYIKKYYTLDNVLKKEKLININKERQGRRFMLSVDRAFNYLVNYLVNNQGYEIVEM